MRHDHLKVEILSEDGLKLADPGTWSTVIVTTDELILVDPNQDRSIGDVLTCCTPRKPDERTNGASEMGAPLLVTYTKVVWLSRFRIGQPHPSVCQNNDCLSGKPRKQV